MPVVVIPYGGRLRTIVKNRPSSWWVVPVGSPHDSDEEVIEVEVVSQGGISGADEADRPGQRARLFLLFPEIEKTGPAGLPERRVCGGAGARENDAKASGFTCDGGRKSPLVKAGRMSSGVGLLTKRSAGLKFRQEVRWSNGP